MFVALYPWMSVKDGGLIQACYYRSLAKERPWAEHLISLSKRGVGTLLSVSAVNHERAPMSNTCGSPMLQVNTTPLHILITQPCLLALYIWMSANSGGSCTLVRRYTRYSCPLAKNPLLGLGLKVKQRSKGDQRPWWHESQYTIHKLSLGVFVGLPHKLTWRNSHSALRA